MIEEPPEALPAFTELVDLAAERTGGAVLLANDEFFAPKENLLKPERGVWIEDRYTDRGKWMDGWETRRKREPGHDWAIVRLGLPGTIRGVDVDTNHFKGNFPEACSIDACAVEGDPSAEELLSLARFFEVLPRTPLRGHSRNFFPIDGGVRSTHVRLNIHPDGGVARLRVHGEVVPDWRRLARFFGTRIDLAAVEHGGVVVAANDQFFGPRHNLIMPGRAANMGDGWETRRKRKLPGSDWVLVALGAAGTIASAEVDTNHFKGNFPESCIIEGCDAGEDGVPPSPDDRARWQEILPRTKLRPHARHFFDEQIRPHGPVTHVRLVIFPDGGVSRLRLYGAPSAAGFARATLRRLNALPRDQAEAELGRCCGSSAWASRMAGARPFRDRAALLARADEILRALGPADRLEAIRAHPRIGSASDVSKKTGQERAWAEGEQAGARSASAATLESLVEVNRAYEERFGYVYVVCATGRSADEMLALARARLANDPAEEIAVASEEQAKITRIRLEKMLQP